MKARQYKYLAYDRQGRKIEGARQATDEDEIVAILGQQGLTPVAITPLTDAPGRFRLPTAGGGDDLLNFTAGLATLIETRVPIDKALSMLEELAGKPEFKKMVNELHREVKEGGSLHQAMAARPAFFSPMYTSMIRAGEEGGILHIMLPGLMRFLEESGAARRQIIAALIYPSVLLGAGALSILLMLTVVVPQFAIIFDDAGVEIPTSAAFLMAASRWLTRAVWFLPLLPLAGWYGWQRIRATPEQQRRFDLALLKLPLLGDIMLNLAAAAFSKTLGALLTAGVPLLKALRVTGGVISNAAIRHQLSLVEEQVRGGQSLGAVLAQDTDFPPLLPRMVTVGEESGRTPAILTHLGEHFSSRARQRITRLIALLEPLLILVLGFFIGGIIMIMLSAVFSLNETGF